jgi:hypothetical protein
MIKIKAKLNYEHKKAFENTTIKLERMMENDAIQVTRETAEEIVKYITENWSPRPSREGQFPAKRDGYLNDGITVEKQGRNRGRFAGKYGTSHFIRFDTSDSGRGQYALAVNDGNRITNAAERPYIEPTMKKFASVYEDKLIERIRLQTIGGKKVPRPRG